ncbi:hypothetical protein N0V82_004890 [Gnomoniopsis sp. IMI 355080]|nr:hypothetical protein N0V82_004890 [Gnomoniopsis sp. IMI 355080]
MSSDTVSATSLIQTTPTSSTEVVSESSISSDSVPASSSVETTLITSSILASTTPEVTESVSSESVAASSSIETTPAIVSVASTASEVASESAASSTVSSTASEATSALPSVVAIANAPAAAEMCADNQDTVLTEWGLVVSNYRVEESSVEGTVCTTYNGMVTLPDGQAAVKFTADANLVFEEATINDNKYYSNAGLGANVPSQLSSISSIPASYSWSRTNTTAFRGNVAFDFVLAPTSDDRTSSATKEVMMWLHWQGDQLPLAWNNGTKATLDLYGTTWDMYQGINYNIGSGSGVQLTTILPQTDFGATGSWSGDIKDWLDALVAQGLFTDDYYVTNANAGTEQYWGDSVLVSTVSLAIDLIA